MFYHLKSSKTISSYAFALLLYWPLLGLSNVAPQAVCPINSFGEDTLVHTQDARGNATLKAIADIKVGDQVLANSEWKADAENLSYETVNDIYSSHKQQIVVYITLADGSTLTATEGHPFKTTDGWRDAILLKKGGKLLQKGEQPVTIVDIRTEQKILPVYNLEVANAHTFFVGEEGVLVHNAKCNPGKNDPHINQKAKDKAKDKLDALKDELKQLKEKGGPRTQETREKLKDLENKIKHAQNKANASGENHSMKGK